MSYWTWTWHRGFQLRHVCLDFSCSPQLLPIKIWSCDQQKKRHRVNNEGRELSKFGQMLFILLCQQCHAIHYVPVWSETYECPQKIATPRDKANCCCITIVFKAPFCGWLANLHSNKRQMDSNWQCPSCGKYNFCFWLWNMILFFPSLILGFSCPLSLSLFELLEFSSPWAVLRPQHCQKGLPLAHLVATLGQKNFAEVRNPPTFCLGLIFPSAADFSGSLRNQFESKLYDQNHVSDFSETILLS